MSLGERIYRLRTEKNLSQGDLAERLEVSRQSISKWENNNAVPELEKIIKLSEILGVSLDELVKGEPSAYRTENINVKQEEKVQGTANSQRTIIGVILLCMTFLLGLLSLMTPLSLWGFILFVFPFLICGILCLTVRKNLGLWCVWVIYVFLDIFINIGMGISRGNIFSTLMWEDEMNYGRLALAWVLVIGLVVLIVVTAIRFRKIPFASVQQGKKKMIIAWVVVATIYLGLKMLASTDAYGNFIMKLLVEMRVLFFVYMHLLSLLRVVTLTVAIVFTARFIEMKKYGNI